MTEQEVPLGAMGSFGTGGTFGRPAALPAWVSNVAEKIEPVHASQVLYIVGERGPAAYAPGNFHAKLIEAMLAADSENQRRLLGGYPSLGGAVFIWRNVSGGADVLRTIAESQL